MSFITRLARPEDACALAGIYNHYVLHDHATFELAPVSTENFAERIEKISKTYPYLVLEEDGEPAAYAYASTYRERPAYFCTTELTFYVHNQKRGKGMAQRLAEEMLPMLKDGRFVSAVSVIALPNPASLKLHQRFGFKEVGVIAKAGYKFNRYYDTAIWQLML